MAFKDFQQHTQSIELLQRSLEQNRLAHAYLFSGVDLFELENISRTLAKVLNCERPVKRNGAAVDCCDQCHSCHTIERGNNPDVHWVRPESKSRIITINQTRDLIGQIQLKPTAAVHKVAIIVAADRLKVEAANAFLKTLEEPPPRSILILTTTDPQRVIETITSRCLRLNFGGEGSVRPSSSQINWLVSFAQLAAAGQKSLFGRYRLMDVLLAKLGEARVAIEKSLMARSPLEQFPDAEKPFQDKWEDELKAAVEAEYRRERADWLKLLHAWLRDVWLETLREKASSTKSSGKGDLFNFPQLEATVGVAKRISAADAQANLKIMDDLQQSLATNVQEALAIEVSLLKLNL
jgi:DNA polymerase-3 subunit delta'